MKATRRWEAVEIRTLREAWTCGMSSGDIAALLGRSWNSIMGRIARDELVGMQGRGAVASMPANEIAALVEEVRRDLTGRARSDRDGALTLMIAWAATGRRSRRAAQAAGVTRAYATTASRLCHASGLWPTAAGPDPSWWRDGGRDRMLADAALIDGITTRAIEDERDAG